MMNTITTIVQHPGTKAAIGGTLVAGAFTALMSKKAILLVATGIGTGPFGAIVALITALAVGVLLLLKAIYDFENPASLNVRPEWRGAKSSPVKNCF